MPAARSRTELQIWPRALERSKQIVRHAQVSPLILVALFGAIAYAQSSARRPDQFYTNGESVNAWTSIPAQKRQTTFWFALHPADSAAYRQMLAINFDDRPNQVFYVDSATRLFVGRLDLNTDQFSLLPKDARRGRLQDIEESSFPPAGNLPRVAEMFEPLAAGERGNDDRLLLPPPTLKFPRLKNSSWETSYMAIDRTRVRSRLDLQNTRGTYRLRDKPGVGQLSDIQYDTEGDKHVIRGHWVLGNSSGWFKFDVAAENLNAVTFHRGLPRGWGLHRPSALGRVRFRAGPNRRRVGRHSPSAPVRVERYRKAATINTSGSFGG